jgi:hypothetical protein
LGYDTYIHGSATRNLPVYLKQTKIPFFSFIKSKNRREEQVWGGVPGWGWYQ